MKKQTISFALISIMALMSSCLKSSETNWEYSPVSFGFDITDDKGNSLIDPTSVQGQEWLNNITIEYNGTVYHNEGRPIRELRAAQMPSMERYKAFNVLYMEKRYYLQLGEFMPNYRDKNVFKLNLPNGKSQIVEFVHYFENNTYISSVWVNGIKTKGRIAKIVTDTYITDKNSPAAVYAYFLPKEFIKAGADASAYNGLTITYGDKEYKLQAKPDAAGALTFYRSSAKLLNLTYEEGYYFAFGPFNPTDNLKRVPMKVTLGKDSIPLVFSCYVDEMGQIIYEIESASVSPYNKKLYYKNGTLMILPF